MREDINAQYKEHKSAWNIVKTVLHYISKVFLWSVFLILLIAAITLVVYVYDYQKNLKSGGNPIPLFNAYIIVSPSMVPAIKVQDAVVIKRTDASKLQKDDVITFDSKDPRYSGLTITHRIVGIENKGTDKVLFRTKGDNNNAEDAALVKADDIYGKVILVIPKIGYLQFFLSQTYGWIIAIVIPCLGIIIYDIIKLIKTIKEIGSSKKKDQDKDKELDNHGKNNKDDNSNPDKIETLDAFKSNKN